SFSASSPTLKSTRSTGISCLQPIRSGSTSSFTTSSRARVGCFMLPNLFDVEPRDVALADGALVLGGFALPFDAPLVEAFQRVVDQAPLRNMLTPGGRRMSVAMTNCGSVGWVSDR